MKPKYKIGEHLLVHFNLLDIRMKITTIGHFGSEAHYGFIAQGNNKVTIGWIPCALLDEMNVTVEVLK